MMHTQPSKLGRLPLLALLAVLLLALSACDMSATPPTPGLEPTAETTGFEIRVDPETQEVTVVEPDADAASIASLQEGGESRLLMQGRDIRFGDFSFQFQSPDKLIVRLQVENITDDLNFAQPFFFTLSSTSQNVVTARAPLVTDAQLGGDGVLSPGETSKRFRFVVTFEEDEPFTFFVDANAKVVATASCTSPVAIPDENLEAAIRGTLDKQEGALTCEDLASLETFSTQGVGIVTNLEGLQFAVNLTDLSLDGDSVSDLGPLEDLTGLESLSVTGNSLSDLSPLRNLTNLTTLNLNFNNVSDLNPLENLTRLETLLLLDNDVSALSSLENLTSLTFLDLESNAVSDLTPLTGLVNLTALDLRANSVSDLSPLENLTSLMNLVLAGNDISDISALVGNSGLDEGDFVDLFGNPLSPQALEDVEALETRGVDVSF